MNVQVVIPHGRDDSAGRRRVREHVVAHYLREHPGWDVVQAPCPTAAWSKGRAANPHLLESAADVVVLADADSWTDPRMLGKAVAALAAGTSRWAMPQTIVKRITHADTARILNGEQLTRPGVERQARALPGGGIVAATPGTWQTVNGVDPRFAGWGGEDSTLGTVLRALCGQPWTPPMPTTLWHLWHPSGKRRPSQPTVDLWRRYRRARRETGAIAAIVKEW